MTNELFASGARFFRIFAGMFIRPLLSTVYENEPLNEDTIPSFEYEFWVEWGIFNKQRQKITHFYPLIDTKFTENQAKVKLILEKKWYLLKDLGV